MYGSWDRVIVSNEQATYQLTPPPLEGALRFYQSNGKPTLYMDDVWATFHAVVTKEPAKPVAQRPKPTACQTAPVAVAKPRARMWRRARSGLLSGALLQPMGRRPPRPCVLSSRH